MKERARKIIESAKNLINMKKAEDKLKETSYMIGQAVVDETIRKRVLEQTGAPDLATLSQWIEKAGVEGWNYTEMIEKMKDSLKEKGQE